MNPLIRQILLLVELIELRCDAKLHQNAEINARRQGQGVVHAASEALAATHALGSSGFDVISELADILQSTPFHMETFDLSLLNNAKNSLLAYLFPAEDYYNLSDFSHSNQIKRRLSIYYPFRQMDNLSSYCFNFSLKPKTLLEEELDCLIQGVTIYNTRVSFLIRNQEIEKAQFQLASNAPSTKSEPAPVQPKQNTITQKQLKVEHLPDAMLRQIMSYLQPCELSILFYDIAIHFAFKTSFNQLLQITTEKNIDKKVFFACNPFLFYECAELQKATNQVLQKGIPAELLGYLSIKQFSLIPWVNFDQIKSVSKFKELHTDVLCSQNFIIPYVSILSRNAQQVDVYYWINDCWHCGTGEYSHQNLAIKIREALARPLALPKLPEVSGPGIG
ncbi:MAG: hypothetical protein CK426_04555 [Legionella sp.]|nr:MAG: hypothetical protein CK423_09285 [Legionella sp.]PJD98848.1 MAG: hypothetical protein CK426_04555 [Legionella sp.]